MEQGGCRCSFLLGVLCRCVSASCLVFATSVLAQESVDELRNNYNFLQAGLSTLAAGASVALCLARGRLDSEMGVADFFTLTRLTTQNRYGSYVSAGGNNGTILGVHVRASSLHDNAVMWAQHNTWAQGNVIAMVGFEMGWPSMTQTGSQHPPGSPPTPTQQPVPCTCWHIPSITAHGSARGGAAALQQVEKIEPQCYRVPSYQCAVHGQAHMPELYERVETEVARGTPLAVALEGPSQLVQWMKEEEERGEQYTYFFGVDMLGARTLTRMVSESLATLDASEKGRTSDLVDWSLGRLELWEKPDIKWKGSASTVVLVSLFEVLLMLVLSFVFGLDPFVSSLGARRGVRSLRLGAGGVTNFADLWLLEVKGYNIKDWDTPVLRVKPRANLRLWYVDTSVKMLGLLAVFIFWITSVFGYVHPLGLKRNQAWGSSSNASSWTVYVGSLGTLIGFFTCVKAMGALDRFFPSRRHEKGFGMLGYSVVECGLEVAFAVLRLLAMHVHELTRGSKWLQRSWFVLLELGVWLQWFTAKRALSAGPHSDSLGIPWELTALQAGALARATILAAVSGSWSS